MASVRTWGIRVLLAALVVVIGSKVFLVDVHVLGGGRGAASTKGPSRAAIQPTGPPTVWSAPHERTRLRPLPGAAPPQTRPAAPATPLVPAAAPVVSASVWDQASSSSQPSASSSASSSASAAASAAASGAPVPAPAPAEAAKANVWASAPAPASTTAPAPVAVPPSAPAPPPEASEAPAPAPAPAPTAGWEPKPTEAIPVVSDLEWHMGNSHCWEHFDLGFLKLWNDRAEVFCSPRGSDGSSLTCRETVDKHLPPATAPHTMCDGTNIAFNFEILRKAKCQKHRPGYNCKGDAYWWSYPSGALTGACTRVDRAFTLKRFPRDHLRDIFDSWRTVKTASELAQTRSEAPVTLFITRERNEHANLFHAMTDMLNAYQALHMTNIVDATREGSRDGMDGVQVVLLDEQPEGPFDMAFKHVFSQRYPVMRPSLFLKSTPQVTFPKAIFVHPGYTNFLFVQLFQTGSCQQSLQLLQSFRLFFLAGIGIADTPRDGGDDLNILFISRRPYTKFVEHRFMGRQVTNEKELITALDKMPQVKAELVDFAQITFQEQIKRVTESDIMIGMHGAALTHALFLPPWGGVLELWPKDKEMWRCFEHWSQMAGHAYKRWENKDRGAFRKDRNGDYTRVNVDQFMALAQRLAEDVKRQRDVVRGTISM